MTADNMLRIKRTIVYVTQAITFVLHIFLTSAISLFYRHIRLDAEIYEELLQTLLVKLVGIVCITLGDVVDGYWNYTL